MRVAIITPSAPAHHLYFCAHLASRHDVVGVVHPSPRNSGRRSKVRRLRRQTASSGLTLTALRLLTSAPGGVRGWDARRALADGERRLFADAATAYDQAGIGSVAHRVEDINAPASTQLVRDLDADIVVCLGGPIYRAALIDACGTMINFHSGISPLYNGASTIMFAFANGHVRLCGGTLMTMSPVVDGGDVLAHYLPSIEPGDDPATLFLKTVRGAAEVVSRFLAYLEATGRFAGVAQTPPLFYTRGEDWTIRETHRVRRLLEQNIAAQHVRDEELVKYWDLTDAEEAARVLRRTVERLIGIR